MSTMELLYPTENTYRHHIDLSGLWYFAFDNPQATGWENKIPKDKTIAVPAGFNEFFLEKENYHYQGTMWYEKSVFVGKQWLGEEVYLRLDGVMHRAIVYVNGIEIDRHEGAFTPSIFEVTKYLRYGDQNTIVIKVNNELSKYSLPTGQTIKEEKGTKAVTLNGDLLPFGGLHRGVHLFTTPDIRFVDVSVETVELTKESATIHYVAQVRGNCLVTATLRDREGRVMATAVGGNASLTVENPHVWSIGDGYLYRIDFEVSRLGKQTDAYSLPIGIRTFTQKAGKFYLNGEEVYLKGASWLDEGLLLGQGSTSLGKDFSILKWMGANCVRSAGLPYSEEFLNWADREGILVIQEIPGFGLHNRDKLFGDTPFFDGADVQSRTLDHHGEALRLLMNRDKNHPSLIMWNVAEVPATTEESSKAYFERLMEQAKQIDLQHRPISYTIHEATKPQEDCCTYFCDVLFLNRNAHASSKEVEEALYQELLQWHVKYADKPIVITRYGAKDDNYHGFIPLEGSIEFQREQIEAFHKIFDLLPVVQGEFIWNFIDSKIIQGERAQGIIDGLRRPKALALQLRKRWCRGNRKADLQG